MSPPARLNWARLARQVGPLAVSLLALGLILRRIDLFSLGPVLARAKLGWIIVAGISFGVAFLFAAARWHLVLRLNGCQVHATATGKTVLVGHLFNTILFGPAGGDIAKSALYCGWFGFATPTILGTCAVDRFLGGVGFFIFVGCTPGFALYSGHLSARLKTFLSSPRTFWEIAGVLAVLWTLHQLRRRFHWPSPLKKLTQSLMMSCSQLLRHPKKAAGAILLAVLSHFFVSAVFACSLEAVTRAPVSLLAVFWIFPVISVITAAPVTFAGAGLREGAAILLLGMYGIPESDAVAAALLVLMTYLAWAGISGFILWRETVARQQMPVEPAPQTISVIIPTLNEAEALPATIASVRQVPEIDELVIVDAGSTDGTRKIAEQLGCKVLPGPCGRGSQLHIGAAQARGAVLIFLHADTWLSPGSGQALLNCLRDPCVVAGGFWKVFREKRVAFAGSRARCALRLFLFHRVLGDQAMFVRRRDLEAVGGVPEVPIMEEFELCRRLRTLGRLTLASDIVSTSARRFAKFGVIRTYWRMWRVTTHYYLGTPLSELRRIYERE
jgi:rSAM/selenodomain-associated transferase 2